MRFLSMMIVLAAALGASACQDYGYVANTKLARQDRDPMVGPVRATNARTMYERLEREMPLGGPKEQ
jgi:hypothetical protein